MDHTQIVFCSRCNRMLWDLLFSWSISSARLFAVCRRWRKINPLSLTAADVGAGWGLREREKPVPSILLVAELMHGWVLPFSPMQYTQQEKRPPKQRCAHTHVHAGPVHERKRRRSMFDLVERHFLGGGVGGALCLEINESAELYHVTRVRRTCCSVKTR